VFDLTGRTALVTGSSRGIGRAIALSLAAAGARTVTHGHHPSEALERTSQEVGGVAVTGDLGDVDQARLVVECAFEHLGRLDILVNNAGIVTPMAADDVDPDTWDRIIAVNLRGAFFAAQTAARYMRANHYGRIVSISSQAAEAAIPGYIPYGVSKAGLNLLTTYLASAWAADGITVNCVAPAFVRTELTAEVFRALPDLYEDQLARVPVRRMCEPDEVAAAVLYLCSEEAGFTTGEILHTDGGYLTE
jgi:NAD(P)-dependent dehydrogenase (short-subunit alcohol dehydrogenase family)